MSVTFTPAIDTTITAWAIHCSCGHTVAPESFDDYGQAAAARGTAVPCPDEFCAAFPVSVVPQYAEVAPAFDVSNVNAGTLLEVLGLHEAEGDLCGSVTATDMLGRVLLAVAVNPVDAGRPSTTNGRMIDCGRDEGYVDGRLAELRTISEWAAARDLAVRWS